MSGYNGSLEVLFSKMENFISSKTVVGEPISIGNVIIVPLVDVAFGVGAGSSGGNKGEKASGEKGAGGLGAKITPSAVLVIQNGAVQLVNVKNQTSLDKLIDMVPGVMSKFDFFSDNEENVQEVVESEEE